MAARPTREVAVWVLWAVVAYNVVVLVGVVRDWHVQSRHDSLQDEVDDLNAQLDALLRDVSLVLPGVRRLVPQGDASQSKPPTTKHGDAGLTLGDAGLTLGDGHNVVTQARHGLMMYNKNDEYVGKSVGLYGEWQESEVELFALLVGEGDTVVDVGAGFGAITLALARLTGASGRVYAFEPQRVLFQMLCANVQLNHMRHVMAYPEAVGDRPGSFTWHVHPNSYTTPANFGDFPIAGKVRDRVSYDSEGEHDEAVLVNALDNYRLKGTVALLKITVTNDMVLPVLRGAEDVIEESRPALYLNFPTDPATILDFFRHRRYHVFIHTNYMYNPHNFKGNGANQLNFVSDFYVCVPVERFDRMPRLQQAVRDNPNVKPTELAPDAFKHTSPKK